MTEESNDAKKVEEFDVIIHGVEHEQFFQGCGTSFTKFTDCATGIGNSEMEAFEDALDMLAQSDWDVESIVEDNLSTEDEVCEGCDESGPNGCDGCEKHVYVSVRVR